MGKGLFNTSTSAMTIFVTFVSLKLNYKQTSADIVADI